MYLGSKSVFLFIKSTRMIKVTTIFYCQVKHGSFPSLCIGENHETGLEYLYTNTNHIICWNRYCFKWDVVLFSRWNHAFKNQINSLQSQAKD